jgi:putative addiction module antidote
MHYNLKIRKIGNSLGAVFPKELLQKLNIQEGDNIFLTETPDGVRMTPYVPEFEAAMEAFEKTRKNYRNALRELAK